MNFFEILNLKYDDLKKTEKRIANYIREYYEETVRMTAVEIGTQSGTSSASVVRFCKTMGYSGLEEMKIDIASYLKADISPITIDPIISPDDTMEELYEKLKSNIEISLAKLSATLDFQEAERAIEAVKKADFVYLFGIGASSLSAMDLYHKLNRINIRTMFNSDGHMALEFATCAGKGDVGICISYGGESKEVYLAAKELKARGAVVIAITRDQKSSLTRYSDIILRIPDNESTVRVGAISSKFAQMAVVDMLFLGVVQKKFPSAEKHILESSVAVKRLKT